MKKITLAGLLLSGLVAIRANAQEDHSDGFGSNNIYYNSQYNEGVYTNPSYRDLDISFNDFYELLAPYGQWIEDEKYGFVFSPEVDGKFRPYFTNGKWAYTPYGNVWVSDYLWGWACFHYGRWMYDEYYGWLWVPGSDWGPAWVSWKSNTGFLGWAPLSPGYEVTIKELNQYKCPKDWWVFLPSQYVYGGNYYRYWNGASGNSAMLKGTEILDNMYTHNDITYVAGPTKKQAEALTGKSIVEFKVNNAGYPKASYFRGDIIKMYRPPVVKQVPGSGERIPPPNYVVAPRPVSAEPASINTNLGAKPQFRIDLPGIQKKTLRPIMTIESQTGTGKPVNEDEHRADRFPYKTDLKIPEPQRPRGSYTIPKKKEEAAPTQGTQKPEPVVIPKEKKNAQPPVNPEQHSDPIPQHKNEEREPQPVPKQRPEPITR